MALIFSISEEFHFLAFTATSTELSMILDQRDVNDFPQINCMSRQLLVRYIITIVIINYNNNTNNNTNKGMQVETHPWKAIKRVDKSSVGETEIVNSISTSLADANISLLYLSVSNTSIILVS